MSIDKNKIVLDWLMSCPQIKSNPLFFNFAEAKDNNKLFVTVANDKIINKPYIDGSVLRRYTFSIIDYRSVAYQALVNVGQEESAAYQNENLAEMFDVQAIIDWITEQAENKNYPDFGTDYSIEEMQVTTDTPDLNGVDTSVKPALAKYSFTIKIDYLDNTKVIWK